MTRPVLLLAGSVLFGWRLLRAVEVGIERAVVRMTSGAHVP